MYSVSERNWSVNKTGIHAIGTCHKVHRVPKFATHCCACATITVQSTVNSSLVKSTKDSRTLFVFKWCPILPVHVSNLQIAADPRNCTHSVICLYRLYAIALSLSSLSGWRSLVQPFSIINYHVCDRWWETQVVVAFWKAGCTMILTLGSGDYL